MNKPITDDFPKVRKFIYKFGYKTTIDDAMYPAYHTAWLISIFGCDVDKKFIEQEKKNLQEYLDRQK